MLSFSRRKARVSFRRIEAFLSRSADDVRNDEVYGKAGSDRHCPDLALGQLKIEDGEMSVRLYYSIMQFIRCTQSLYRLCTRYGIHVKSFNVSCALLARQSENRYT